MKMIVSIPDWYSEYQIDSLVRNMREFINTEKNFCLVGIDISVEYCDEPISVSDELEGIVIRKVKKE